MALNPIQKSLKDYLLREQELNAFNNLSSLLDEAEEEGLHGDIGLREKLRASNLREIRNHRDAITRLLKQRLESEPDDKKKTPKRRLIQEIIEGIGELDRLQAELYALEHDDENGGPEPDNGPESSESPDKSAA